MKLQERLHMNYCIRCYIIPMLYHIVDEITAANRDGNPALIYEVLNGLPTVQEYMEGALSDNIMETDLTINQRRVANGGETNKSTRGVMGLSISKHY